MKTHMTWRATCPKCKTKITQEDCTCINCAQDKYYMRNIKTMGENTYSFECPNCRDNHHEATCKECGSIYLNSIHVHDLMRNLTYVSIGIVMTMIIGTMIWIFA